MIGIGSDHRGYALKKEIIRYLEEIGVEYKDFGTNSTETTHHPIYAANVARAVQDGECESGILICGSGNGMVMVANKFKNVRCALCYNEETGKLAKQHLDANIIAFPADYIDQNEAIRGLREWLGASFLNGRYLERKKMVEEIEKENMK